MIETYHLKGHLTKAPAIAPFYLAILPILRPYGLENLPREWKPSALHGGGDPKAAHLHYEGILGAGDYTPVAFGDNLEGRNLRHLLSGEPLELMIQIIHHAYVDSRLEITFTGETDEVEALRNALQPVLINSGFVE